MGNGAQYEPGCPRAMLKRYGLEADKVVCAVLPHGDCRRCYRNRAVEQRRPEPEHLNRSG